MARRERGDAEGFLRTITAGNAGHAEASRGFDFMYPLFLVGYSVDRLTIEDILARLPRVLPFTENDALYLMVWMTMGEAGAFVGDTARMDDAWEHLLPFASRFALDGTAAVCYGPVSATLARIARGAGRRRGRAALVRRRAHCDRADQRTTAPRSARARAWGGRGRATRAERARSSRRRGALRARGRHVAARVRGSVHPTTRRKGLARPRGAARPARRRSARARPRRRERRPWSIGRRGRRRRRARARRPRPQRVRGADPRSDGAHRRSRGRQRHRSRRRASTTSGRSSSGSSPPRSASRAAPGHSRATPNGRARRSRCGSADAIGRIDRELPALGSHLRNSVRTGIFCSYRPEQPVEWRL